MKPHCTPTQLAQRLGGLPVEVAAMEVRRRAVSLPDYPGRSRPTSVILVSGMGEVGVGENVAFTEEEQDQFLARVNDMWSRQGSEVRRSATVNELVESIAGSWSEAAAGGPSVNPVAATVASRYRRAALEAALIDLAMRQRGVSLMQLTGVAEAPLTAVVSFAATADPCGRIRHLRASGYQGGFKIDVDESWSRSVCEELAQLGGVAILDFKGRGRRELAQEMVELFPAAIFEDPPDGTKGAAVSRDMVVPDAEAVARALSAGEVVNLKAPRMGGPLELLRGLNLAWASAKTRRDGRIQGSHSLGATAEVTSYFGGMFEVGVGRTQARQLAALYCGDAPNDLALNVEEPPPEVGATTRTSPSLLRPAKRHARSSHVVIRLDQSGFGALAAECPPSGG